MKKLVKTLQKNVDQRYSQIPTKEADIESEWPLFRTAVLDAATETCGIKSMGVQNDRKKTAW